MSNIVSLAFNHAYSITATLFELIPDIIILPIPSSKHTRGIDTKSRVQVRICVEISADVMGVSKEEGVLEGKSRDRNMECPR